MNVGGISTWTSPMAQKNTEKYDWHSYNCYWIVQTISKWGTVYSTRNTCFSSIILPISHISISSSSNQMQWLVLDSYELVVFIGVKGAWSGEGEVKGESKVISVGALFIIPWFPFVLASGLPLPAMSFHMVKKPGEWFFMFDFQIVEPIKCTICMKNNNFSPFYILCLTVHQETMSRAQRAQRAPRGSGSYESF